MDNEKVIEMETVRTGGVKEDAFKRKLKVVKDIAIDSSLIQLRDVKTLQVAAVVGLWQGLKYRGNLKRGLNAGVATVAVITGCNVVNNLINHYDKIKDA